MATSVITDPSLPHIIPEELFKILVKEAARPPLDEFAMLIQPKFPHAGMVSLVLDEDNGQIIGGQLVLPISSVSGGTLANTSGKSQKQML
jgi:hypothetical protein